jgi:Mlc titration factor MtfA (ptsG expression regulator)
MEWLKLLLNPNRPQIPEPLWRACVARLPFLRRLSASDLVRLKSLSEKILATKTITGASELEMTDEIAVLIAAQAGLLVLNLTLDLYDDMAGIIVYPSAFIVPVSEIDEAGVVHEWREPLSGEAVHAGGAVVLSWEDVESAHHRQAGRNVVIHEFAHKIDMARGSANGFPPFLEGYHQEIHARKWQRAFSAAYADFSDRVDVFEHQLPPDFDPDSPEDAQRYDAFCATVPMDPYAATHPAEFFAVASEVFFVEPAPLAAAYPDVYKLLTHYYRQDPLSQVWAN